MVEAGPQAQEGTGAAMAEEETKGTFADNVAAVQLEGV